MAKKPLEPWKIPLGANPNSVCSVSRPRMKVLRKLLTNHMTCMNVCDCLNPFVIRIIIFGIHSYSLQKSTSLSNSIIYCPKLDLLFAWLNCCRSEKDSFLFPKSCWKLSIAVVVVAVVVLTRVRFYHSADCSGHW